MSRAARYAPASLPGTDAEFQRPLDTAPEDAFKAMVRHLATLASRRG